MGFIHDVNTIQSNIDDLKLNHEIDELQLIGDKGYIGKQKIKYKNQEIKLITPNKKNQKENTENDKQTLKKRIYVENALSKLKKSERVLTRKDHNILSYMSFVYLAATINNLKQL